MFPPFSGTLCIVILILIIINFFSMKSLKLFSIIFLSLFVCGANAQTTTYSYTGGTQYFTVPAGTTLVHLDVKGAAGGNDYTSLGGCGGRVQCNLTVSAGQVLNIYVGAVGTDGSFYSGGAGGRTGTFTSGGVGGWSFYAGGAGGGGGCTDVRTGGVGLANRVVAAGGGGGAGVDYCGVETGGDGGGPGTAADGLDCGSYSSASCGAGGTAISGGAGSSGGGIGGVSFIGGAGISPTISGGYYPYYYTIYTFQAGGGGGGGYYGGGGGSAGGGGGGSSYAAAGITSAVVHTQGSSCADGSVIISIPCVPPVAGPVTGPATLCVGSAFTYTTTSTPGGTWTSTFPAVASINPLTGAVNALTPGTTTITYSLTNPCGTITATTSVTVIAGAPAPITGRNPICLDLDNVYPDTLADATPGGTWSSGTPGVGTIDPSTGIFRTFTPGTTTITYSLGACSVTMLLTVNPRPRAIVGPSTVCRFLSMTLTDPTPGGTWSSSVPAAASITPAGLVTGVGPGGSATNIVYTLPTGCDTTHFVSIIQPPLPITGPSQVCQNNAVILVEPIGGGTWTSSAPPTATVTSGVVTGLLPGTVTIAYTTPTCPPATHIVTVNPLPTPIYGPSAICVGMSTTLLDTTLGGTWTSLDPSITVSSTGVVTSSTPGISGVIVYTLPTTCFTTTTVNVGVPPSAILGPDSICVGTDSVLTDTTSWQIGVWSSTDLAIASIVDTSGVIHGVSAGTVNISYTLPSGCFAVKSFVVEPPVTPSVSISYFPTGIICEGSPDTFVATPANAGIASYLWRKFSGFGSFGVADTTSDTLIYNPTHGDAVMCFMHVSGVCALVDHATDTIVVNVYPNNVTPAVTISTSSSDTLQYLGEVITFYASVTWGGTMPVYQWYHNSVLIPGANAMSYSTPVYGLDTFWCVVSGNPPCELTPPGPGMSNKIIIYDFMGVKPVSAGSNSFSLFPNPNTGMFTLTGVLASGSDNEVGLEVSDVLGQVVYTGKTVPRSGQVREQITLGNVAPGSYMLRVNTDKGTETFHFVIGK